MDIRVLGLFNNIIYHLVNLCDNEINEISNEASWDHLPCSMFQKQNKYINLLSAHTVNVK